MLRRLLDSPWTYYGLAAVLLVVAILSTVRIRVPSREVADPAQIASLRDRDDLNVVFILIDTLRADRLSAYGYERPTSPVLDQLAATGVRFAHNEAQSSWTKCSMASLWTGLAPTRSGVTRAFHALPDEAVLPAERFREAGFRTAGIFRNGWVEANFGFGQGFERYFKPTPSRTPERFQQRTPGTPVLQGSDLDATEAALQFLRTHGHERFFLYVHYMDVHQYLYDDQAAELGFGTSYSDAYDSAIHWTDRNVGLLLNELETLDLFPKTLVVVGADHGESFYEHGQEGHARTLYREVTEVPLIMGLPFRLDPGIVVEPLVRNIDIWPTVLDLLGLPELPDADGRSLVPLIDAAARGDAPGAFDASLPPAPAFLDLSWGKLTAKPHPLVSVRHGGYRLLDGLREGNRIALFDHRSDPTEQHDLAEAQPDRVAELRAEVERVRHAKTPWGKAPVVEVDEMHLNQLRALGYVVK